MTEASTDQPNVVLVLADDLGFSDLGCYGGEIETPTLDSLATNGIRLAQFYNTPRCSPSRASMLTGLHPHQTGIGILTSDDRPRGYSGSLNDQCVTLAEVLGNGGYQTYLSGKWHVSSSHRSPNGAWPTERGFDEFFGTLSGSGSYYQPSTLTRGGESAQDETLDDDFNYTDAISSEAEYFIRNHHQSKPEKPFFLYVAYTAPHWPLHAPEGDIAKYEGRFDSGWDSLRRERFERLIDGGLIDQKWRLSDRDPTQPPWSHEGDKDWNTRRMEVYAAQVDRMDQGIGQIVSALRDTGDLDNTLFIFLSDNGACAEELPPIPLPKYRLRSDIFPTQTRSGEDVLIGNSPEIVPGSENTFASYGRSWANLSNSPFRLYKRWAHEGGIASPFIVHWPNGLSRRGSIVNAPFQLTDVMPTILDVASVAYPEELDGRVPLPLEGRSMLPVWRGVTVPPVPQYWEHIGNAAVREGNWKLVRNYPNEWELYQIYDDRTELVDVANDHPAVAERLRNLYETWAKRIGVIPWSEVVSAYKAMGRESDPSG